MRAAWHQDWRAAHPAEKPWARAPWRGPVQPAGARLLKVRVAFPEPEGPRKTRNSPSCVSKVTWFTAPSSPSLKTLVRSRVATMAMSSPSSGLLPAGEDAFVLLFRGLGGVFRSFISARHLGKHGGNHPGAERLVNRSGRVSWITHVCGPIQHVTQHFVLIGRLRPVVLRHCLLQIRHHRWETGEVVKL